MEARYQMLKALMTSSTAGRRRRGCSQPRHRHVMIDNPKWIISSFHGFCSHPCLSSSPIVNHCCWYNFCCHIIPIRRSDVAAEFAFTTERLPAATVFPSTKK